MFGLHAGWARSCCVLLFVAWMGRKASSKLRQNSHRSRHIHNNFPFDIFLHIFLYRHERIMCVTSLAARLTCTSSSVPESFEHRSHARELTTTTTSRSFTSNPIQLQQFSMNTRRFWYVMLCVGEEEKKKDLRALTLDFRFQTLFFHSSWEANNIIICCLLFDIKVFLSTL